MSRTAAAALLAGAVALAWWSMSASWLVRLALLFFVGFIAACLAVTPGGLAWLLDEDRPRRRVHPLLSLCVLVAVTVAAVVLFGERVG